LQTALVRWGNIPRFIKTEQEFERRRRGLHLGRWKMWFNDYKLNCANFVVTNWCGTWQFPTPRPPQHATRRQLRRRCRHLHHIGYRPSMMIILQKNKLWDRCTTFIPAFLLVIVRSNC
jgi:hypothetical protein